MIRLVRCLTDQSVRLCDRNELPGWFSSEHREVYSEPHRMPRKLPRNWYRQGFKRTWNFRSYHHGLIVKSPETLESGSGLFLGLKSWLVSCVPDVAFRGATWYRVRVDEKGRRFSKGIPSLWASISGSLFKAQTPDTADNRWIYWEFSLYSTNKYQNIYFSSVSRCP